MEAALGLGWQGEKPKGGFCIYAGEPVFVTTNTVCRFASGSF